MQRLAIAYNIIVLPLHISDFELSNLYSIVSLELCEHCITFGHYSKWRLMMAPFNECSIQDPYIAVSDLALNSILSATTL